MTDSGKAGKGRCVCDFRSFDTPICAGPFRHDPASKAPEYCANEVLGDSPPDKCGHDAACHTPSSESALFEPVISALLRIDENFEDGQDTDVGLAMLSALTTLGYLKKYKTRWEITSLGDSVVQAARRTRGQQ